MKYLLKLLESADQIFMNQKIEENLHIAICSYLRLQHPDVIFTSESSGVRLTMGQAVKAKKMRSGSKLPDLWILEPRKDFAGLFIEIKKESPYNKSGGWKTPHIAEQAAMMRRLKDKGYMPLFIWTFEKAKLEIDSYLALSK